MSKDCIKIYNDNNLIAIVRLRAVNLKDWDILKQFLG